jgi:two-component system response regulator AlgR
MNQVREITRILIVDDEAPARMRIKDLLDDIQSDCPCELVGEAADGQTALDLIVEKTPDILLLDVQMPGMTGIELAQHIASAKITPSPAIIYVTAYDEFALEAFEVHAMDYLLKPVRASRLQEAIQRIQELQKISIDIHEDVQKKLIESLPKTRQNFSVLERNRVLLVPVHDVLFLKAEQKYVTIQTKERSYLTEESLVSIESEMADYFVRAHRNALVARNAIIGVEKAAHLIESEHDTEKSSESWQVIVRDSAERLPISRRQWAIIKALVRGS